MARAREQLIVPRWMANYIRNRYGKQNISKAYRLGICMLILGEKALMYDDEDDLLFVARKRAYKGGE